MPVSIHQSYWFARSVVGHASVYFWCEKQLKKKQLNVAKVQVCQQAQRSQVADTRSIIKQILNTF